VTKFKKKKEGEKNPFEERVHHYTKEEVCVAGMEWLWFTEGNT